MKNQSLSSKMQFYNLAISNSMSSKLLIEPLALYGYDKKKILEGQALYKEVYGLISESKLLRGAQLKATDDLKKLKASVYKQYIIHLKLARIAFKGDKGLDVSLLLSGKREVALSGWLKQARVFYNHALSQPETIAALAKYGVNEEKLNHGKTMLGEVESLSNMQLQAKANFKEGVYNRNLALKTLQNWMSEFIAIARIALDGSQALEIMGIVVPS